MTYVKEVDFRKDVVVIRYTDDEAPAWAVGRELVIDWRKNPNVERLIHVAYHILHLLVTDPAAVAANDEVLQEWVGRLLQEQPEEGHDAP
jgi:hypothetical protein